MRPCMAPFQTVSGYEMIRISQPQDRLHTGAHVMPPASGTRIASITGTLIHHRPGWRFRGVAEFEARDDCIYYTWRMEADDGEFLGSVGRPVSLRTIPPDSDPFEIALTHALEGIRQYRF